MSSQARVDALSKFYPPGTNLTPVGLLDAQNNKSRVTNSKKSPFPSAGVLIHRGLVWYATGDACADGESVPPGQWKCIACEDTKNPLRVTAPWKNPWGFGPAYKHWKDVHGQQVSNS